MRGGRLVIVCSCKKRIWKEAGMEFSEVLEDVGSV